VSVSSLVNSLKGVSSYILRRQLPRTTKGSWNHVLWSPSYFAACCGGAPLDRIKRYIEQPATPYRRGLPRPAFRGLRHSLVKQGQRRDDSGGRLAHTSGSYCEAATPVACDSTSRNEKLMEMARPGMADSARQNKRATAQREVPVALRKRIENYGLRPMGDGKPHA
jgi:putative transposase